MIHLKNKEDIVQIKIAISIGEVILKEIEQYIEPGTTTLTLNNLIEIMIASYGSSPSFKNYKGFPFASCISINEEIIHGVPSSRKLQDGDIIKIDVGINYRGYFSDQARTYVVGKVKDPRHYELISACQEALQTAIEVAKEGNNLEHIAEKIENTALRYGLGILKGFGGHGVGLDVHEEPYISNRLFDSKDIILSKRMVLAIEPMFILLGKGNYKISKNGFTVISDGISAHFEKTIIIE